MASGSERRWRGALLGLAGLTVVAWLGAAGCARPPDRAERHSTPAAAKGPRPAPWGPFFVGAWCGPRTTERNEAAWCNAAWASIQVDVRPLEDPNDRVANRALLAWLDTLVASRDCAIDTLGGLSEPPRVVVRDRAVDPDEATRPGWEERVIETVRAYRGHRSLAGYFLADEPRPGDFDAVAKVARAFAVADSVHPAIVNLSGIAEHASPEAQARWRADASRLVTSGRLSMFSFDAYPFRGDREGGNYLVSLANAAEVARRTGVPFAAVLQFTGFGDVPPVTAAQARALGGLAVAHGACGVTWFTYRTPNPAEPGMHWRGGAVGYDGVRTDRWQLLGQMGTEFRILASELGSGLHPVAHFGGLPAGIALANATVPGVDSVTGGPCTIAHGDAPDHHGAWILVNRDVTRTRTLVVHWASIYSSLSFWRFSFGVRVDGGFDADSRATTIALAPGQAAIIGDFVPSPTRSPARGGSPTRLGP